MFRRASLAVLALLVVAAAATAAPTASASAERRPDAYVLPGDAVYPEGVAVDTAAHQYYVGSTNGGAIYRGELGETTADVWLPAGGDGRAAVTGMKVSGRRLYVAGAATGGIWVYDIATKALVAQFQVPVLPTFLNDVIVTGGAAYVTDSVNPVLYRVADDGTGTLALDTFVDFTGTPFQYQTGFNANGIAASGNGKYLLIVQSNTGKLFRVEIATKRVDEVDLGGASLASGDGILLAGRVLYVSQNAIATITKVRLKGGLLVGHVEDQFSDPSFRVPTTLGATDRRLLVVNSQFDRRATGDPVLPFTVSSVPRF